MTARPAMLRLDLIDPHPANVRTDLGDLTDLASSIRSVGLLQPVTVEPHADRYRLVAGHRRAAAARMAGMVTVPAIIRDDLDPGDVLVAMLVENMQRAALTPIEEANALEALRTATGCSQDVLARRVGKSNAWVSMRLSLLELDEAEQQALTDRGLSVTDAQELVRVERRARAGKAPDSKANRGWDNSPWHLGPTHPLARGAQHLCDQLEHNNRRRLRGTACGRCWEDAIRADERRLAVPSPAQPNPAQPNPAQPSPAQPSPVPLVTAGGRR